MLGAAAVRANITKESPGVTKDLSDGFGSLRAVLDLISAMHTDDKVRP